MSTTRRRADHSKEYAAISANRKLYGESVTERTMFTLRGKLAGGRRASAAVLSVVAALSAVTAV